MLQRAAGRWAFGVGVPLSLVLLAAGSSEAVPKRGQGNPAPTCSLRGPAQTCLGNTLTFTAAVSGTPASPVTHYTWSAPGGRIASGQGTPSVGLSLTASGSISVQALDSSDNVVCSTTMMVAVLQQTTPPQPGPIQESGCTPVSSQGGNVLSCHVTTPQYGGFTDVDFSVFGVSGASYTWTTPGLESWTNIKAQAPSTTIGFGVGATSGKVCVAASNVCGTSAPRCMGIDGSWY